MKERSNWWEVEQRLCAALAAIGFGFSAVASWLGIAPIWPNPFTWAILGAVSSLTLFFYACTLSAHWLRIAVVTVAVAALARCAGWVATGPTPQNKIAALGVWMAIAALAGLARSGGRE